MYNLMIETLNRTQSLSHTFL